jgi:hypothetical protein
MRPQSAEALRASVQQPGCDQKAAQRKEEHDPDVAGLCEPGKPFAVDRVRRQHQQDRDGAQAIKVGMRPDCLGVIATSMWPVE